MGGASRFILDFTNVKRKVSGYEALC
jgi:hypothetical protein